MAQEPPLNQGLLIVEDSWSHSDTPHSVGLLWTSDQLDAETSAWQTTLKKDQNIHAPGGIRTHNPSQRAAADQRIRPRGHCSVGCEFSSQTPNRELTWTYGCTYPLLHQAIFCNANGNTAVLRDVSVVFQCVWKCYSRVVGTIHVYRHHLCTLASVIVSSGWTQE
jgi:hypothetical protein